MNETKGSKSDGRCAAEEMLRHQGFFFSEERSYILCFNGSLNLLIWPQRA